MAPSTNEPVSASRRAQADRLRTLAAFARRTEVPLVVLAFVWLALFVAEMVRPLPRWAELLGIGIWVVFVLDVGMRLAIAPRKLRFLRRNALTLVSLLVPAMRILRFARLLAIARGARVVRLVGSLGRSRIALRRALHRRRTVFVVARTLLVTVGGAAAMFQLERGHHPVFAEFGSTLWWTAMVVVTMGSEAWPVTSEGRLVCLLRATYGFAMLGCIAATLSAFLVGTDTETTQTVPAKTSAEETDLAGVLAQLRELERRIVSLSSARVARPPAP